MKALTCLLLFLAINMLLRAGVNAGEEAPEKNPITTESEAAEEKLWKFTLDSRFRYEFGDQDGREQSHEGSLRNRVGLLLGPVEGFSFFAEYEGTLVVDRSAYQAASVYGLGQNKTIIADPASQELNQLWFDYKNWDSALKVGRQRIILDNARFVGNVGWRQNEQTFDAVTVTNESIEGLRLYYAYINQANRIFGSGPIHNPAQEDFEGDSHLINASYRVIPELTLTGYAYFLDLNTPAGDVASNNSYGVQAKGTVPAGEMKIPYLLEGSYQTDGADNPLDYGAWYGHADAGISTGKVTVGAGFEHLASDNGKGFQTPLATLHAFNGWADLFLSTPAEGLNDTYVYLTAKVMDKLIFKSQFHWFGPDSGSLDYGTEIDAALVYNFSEHYYVGTKYAQYFADEFGADTTRFTVDFGIKF